MTRSASDPLLRNLRLASERLRMKPGGRPASLVLHRLVDTLGDGRSRKGVTITDTGAVKAYVQNGAVRQSIIQVLQSEALSVAVGEDEEGTFITVSRSDSD
jgi:hypothetical protein